MEFEFDEAKSRVNSVKHGIDFLAAQALWLDSLLIEVPARTENEPRFLVIGRSTASILGRHHLSRAKGSHHLGAAIQARGGCHL